MPEQWVDYKALKRDVPIRDVLAHFNALEGLTERGPQLSGCCVLPSHGGDRTNKTAFSANTQSNVFNCSTHCGGGNVIDLYALFMGKNPKDKGQFREAALDMRQTFNQPPPNEPVNRQGVQPQKSPPEPSRQPKTNRVLELNLTLKSDIPFLLDEKRITPAMVELFGTGYCKVGMMAGRVCVPIYNASGELVAYAGRALKQSTVDSSGKWRFPKGFSKAVELYNQHRLDLSGGKIDQLVIVEGFWPVMRFHGLNIPCVSLMGSDMSDTQLERIAGITDHVLLFLDNDDAGRKGTEKIMARLSERVFVGSISYPDERTEPESYTDDQLERLVAGWPEHEGFDVDAERGGES